MSMKEQSLPNMPRTSSASPSRNEVFEERSDDEIIQFFKSFKKNNLYKYNL